MPVDDAIDCPVCPNDDVCVDALAPPTIELPSEFGGLDKFAADEPDEFDEFDAAGESPSASMSCANRLLGCGVTLSMLSLLPLPLTPLLALALEFPLPVSDALTACALWSSSNET